MSEDALERLKRRQRPTVPARNTSLVPVSLDTQTPRYQEVDRPIDLDTEIQTRQSTMRLEIGISDRLSQMCRELGVSREVLIEALLVHFDGNPEIRAAVVSEAQSRHDQRVQLANRKRAQSMMEKFGR
ncbi:MAG: hypothetical protein ACKOB3_03000 [Holophagaceae bacterium]